MVNLFKSKLFVLIVLVAFVTSITISYAYFYQSFTKNNVQLTISVAVGSFDDSGLPEIPSDLLNPETAADLEDIIQSPSIPDDIKYAVLEALKEIAEYKDIIEIEQNILIADSLNNLFSDNKTAPTDSFIVYIHVAEDGTQEVVILHNSGSELTSTEQLLNLLYNQAHSHVNLISTIWQPFNKYDRNHAPIEYKHEGENFSRLYHKYNTGPAGADTSPSRARSNWHEIIADHRYTSDNIRYISGSFVWHDGRFWISTQTIWNTAPNSNWGWNVVNLYQAGSYSAGNIVHVGWGEDARFYRALRATSVAPSEDSCRSGDWQEVGNGWTTNSAERNISHYQLHNTYQAGNEVIFGVSPRMRYQYFVAVKDVLPDQPPIIEVGGVRTLNSEFWAVIT